MGFSFVDGFNGFLAAGLLGPAALLLAGYPQAVCEGLASGPHESWIKSPHGKFGLYAYTVSDIAVGSACASAALGLLAPITALVSVAIHQVSYVSASWAAFGFKKEHVYSIITGAIAGALAIKEQRK